MRITVSTSIARGRIYLHRVAGATEVLVVSDVRWALMHELRGGREPAIYDLLTKLAPVDLVLIEGFKSAAHARIEVYRKAVGKPPLHPQDPHIAGIISDTPFPQAGRPVVGIDDIEGAVALVVAMAEPLDMVLKRLAAPVGLPISPPPR